MLPSHFNPCQEREIAPEKTLYYDEILPVTIKIREMHVIARTLWIVH